MQKLKCSPRLLMCCSYIIAKMYSYKTPDKSNSFIISMMFAILEAVLPTNLQLELTSMHILKTTPCVCIVAVIYGALIKIMIMLLQINQ